MQHRSSIVPREMQNLHERFRYSPGVRAGNLLFIGVSALAMPGLIAEIKCTALLP